MLKAGSGCIVNIASIAGKIGTAKSSGYCASKHAVLGFTNGLRQELHGTGVTLTAINPGPIDTPFFQRADPSGQYVRNIHWMMIKPEAVGKVVLKSIIKRSREVNIPKYLGWGAALMLIFPGIASLITTKFLNKK